MAFDKRLDIHRRQFLASLGIGGATLAAGCIGDDDDDDGEPGETPTPSPTPGDGTPTPGDDFPEVTGSYDAAHHATFSTLNPIFNNEAGAATAIGRTLDAGYTFDEEGEVFPLIYEDIWSDDGSVWVIEIRDNLEFSDPYGSVTAEDFVYLIQEVHQSGVFPSANTINWDGVEVEQTGELEFQATIDTTDPIWPRTFDPLEQPIPKDLIEEYVENEDVEGMEQDTELIDLTFTGNLGPYKLDTWVRDSGTTYTRNDEYYLREIDDGPDLFANAPYFEEATIQLIEEEASRLAALQTGQVDNAGIPATRVEEFEAMDDIDVYSVPTPYNNIYHCNMRDNGWNAGPGNLFQEKKFRQAMAAAVDKQAAIDGIHFGRAEPHFTWQPEWSFFYPDPDEIPEFGMGDMYGEDVAKPLVEEVISDYEYDYYYGDDGMLKTPEGETVELEFVHSDTSPTVRNRAEFYASELADNIGMEVNVDTIDPFYFWDNYWAPDPPYNPEDHEEELTDTVDGREVFWDTPVPNNPGPRSVAPGEPWDLALIFGLNTYARHPLALEVFFDGANSLYNPYGWYPEGWNPNEVFDDIRAAETEEELLDPLQDLFIELAYEQPQPMMTFTDDLEGYLTELVGPIENFNNGWDFPAWHYE